MKQNHHNHLGSFVGLITFGVVIVYVIVSSMHLLNNVMGHLLTH